jgi:hypothetical protein
MPLEILMAQISSILPVVTLAVAIAAGAAFGQTPAPPNTAPGAATTDNKRLDRQLNPGPAAARRAKRSGCDAQARQQKLRLFARMRFVRQCIRS